MVTLGEACSAILFVFIAKFTIGKEHQIVLPILNSDYCFFSSVPQNAVSSLCLYALTHLILLHLRSSYIILLYSITRATCIRIMGKTVTLPNKLTDNMVSNLIDKIRLYPSIWDQKGEISQFCLPFQYTVKPRFTVPVGSRGGGKARYIIMNVLVGRRTRRCECTVHSTRSPHMSELNSQGVCIGCGSWIVRSATIYYRDTVNRIQIPIILHSNLCLGKNKPW